MVASVTDVEGLYPEFILGDVRIVRASRQPCVVCGNKTGDCAGTAQPPRHVIGEGMFRRKPEEPEILVLEDLYDTVQLTPRTSTKVLVARAGTYISRSKALQFGLIDP